VAVALTHRAPLCFPTELHREKKRDGGGNAVERGRGEKRVESKDVRLRRVLSMKVSMKTFEEEELRKERQPFQVVIEGVKFGGGGINGCLLRGRKLTKLRCPSKFGRNNP